VASRERILALISACIEDFNADRAPDERVGVSPDTSLQGPDSALDSLGLIMLAVALEDAFARELNVEVSLVAMLGTGDVADSPLATVSTLASWVESADSGGT
jgi:acyl carrier protein